MEQEVRDLKTSHQIAVGSLTFYRQTAQVANPSQSLSGAIYLRMTMKTGERPFPFFQLHYSPTNNSRDIVGDTYFDMTLDGMIIEIAITIGMGKTYNFAITSTSAFDLIAKPLEPGDWIGPNPPE